MNARNLVFGTLAAAIVATASFLAGMTISDRDVAMAATVSAATPVSPDALAGMVGRDGTVTDAQRAAVEAIIKDYLMKNPEVVRDAINELQRKEDEAARLDQSKAVSENKSLLFSSPRQVVIGNAKGDVTLVEFFDYNCGYCKRAHADMKQLLAEDPNLRVVLKEFPVLGDGSVQAAQVSIAVRMIAPEKSEAFFDALLMEKGEANGERALAVAEELGIDRAALEKKLKSKEVQDTITENYSLATKLNLTGTPSYVTAEEVVVGAVGHDALKEKIALVRSACSSGANC